MATLTVDVQTCAVATPDVGVYKPWTPAQISTQLWLDGAREAAGVLTTWTDRSGNGRSPTQATAGSKPNVLTGVSGLYNRNVVDFDGTADTVAFTTATTLLRNIPSALVFTVYKHDVIPVAFRSALYIAANVNTTTRLLISGSPVGEHYIAGRRLDADTISPHVASALIDTNYHIRAAELKYNATPTAQLRHYLDGTQDGYPIEWQPTTGNTSDTNSTYLRVGAQAATAVNFLDGKIAEIIVVHNSASLKLRQAIEGYLAWKWGLQAQLPVSHPYKSSAPSESIDDGVTTFSVDSAVSASVTPVNVPFISTRKIIVDPAAVVAVAVPDTGFILNGVRTFTVTTESYTVTPQDVTLTVNRIPWTPTEIATEVWWDFSDVANYSLVGNDYFRINDKSGNARHLEQADYLARPTRNAPGQNGLNTGQFTTADQMEFPNFAQASGQQMFFAGDTVTLGTGYRILLQRNTSGGFTGPAVYIGGATSYRAELYWGAQRAITPTVVQAPGLWRWGFTTTPTQTALVQVNAGTVTNSSAFSGQNLSNWSQFSLNTSQQPAFEAFEFIMLPSASATPNNIDRVHGYLAWKWGLVANLPINHPYKNAPPYRAYRLSVDTAATVTVTQPNVIVLPSIPVSPVQAISVTTPSVTLIYIQPGVIDVTPAADVSVTTPIVGLNRSRRLAVTLATVSATAVNVTFRTVPYRFAPQPAASYVVTTPSTIKLKARQRLVITPAQTFSVSTSTVELIRTYGVITASVVATASDTGLLYNRAIITSVNAVTVTGASVDVLARRRIGVSAAFVSTNGKIVNLRIPVDSAIVVTSRAVAVTPLHFEFKRLRVLSVEADACSVGVPAVALRLVRPLQVVTQSVDVSAPMVNFQMARPVDAAVVNVAAPVVELALYRKVTTDATNYNCAVPNVGLNRVRYLPITPVGYMTTFPSTGTVAVRRLIVTTSTVVVHYSLVGTNWFQLNPSPPLIPEYGFRVLSGAEP